MKRRQVVFAPEARDDLVALHDWIAARAGRQTAQAYIARLETYCRGFDLASERGARRDDIRVGLRVVGFERRIAIAFHVDDDWVTILRLFYGGIDWEGDIREFP